MSVGDALVSAKQRYLAETTTLGGIHQKALLEATLYGLPMSAVNLPAPGGLRAADAPRRRIATDAGRRRTPGSRSGSAPPTSRATAGATLSPQFEDARSTVTAPPVASRPRGSAGPNGVVTNPGAPALPARDRRRRRRRTRCCAASGSAAAATPTRRGHAADRCAGDRAQHTALAVRVGRLLPVAAVERQLLRRPAGRRWRDGAKLMLTPVQYQTEAPGLLTNIERKFTERQPAAVLQRLHDVVR